jgi:hypothetical protein
MDNKKMEARPISKKTLYIACGITVTVGMGAIKLVATAINKVVAVLLEVN